MKKILLLLVGFVMSVSVSVYAQTDVYLRGEMSWDAIDTWKMTPAADGQTYIKDGVTLNHGVKFKIAGADWGGDFNYGWTNQTVQCGQDVTLYYNNNEFSTSEKLTNATITFKVTENRNKAVIKIDNNQVYKVTSGIDGSSWPKHELVLNPDNGKYEYTYKGVNGSYELGMVIGSWRGSSTEQSSQFSGSAVSYTMNQTSGGNIKINNYNGDLLCSFDPTTSSLTLSTPIPPVEPETYTIYFYDTTDGSNNAPYAFIWERDNVGYTEWWGNDKEKGKMTDTGKFVKIGDAYYPAYKLTFTWNNKPNYIIIHNENNKYTDYNTNLPFVNGGFYHTGSTAADMEHRTLVNKGEGKASTFYMHWKEDWIKTSKLGDDGKPLDKPRCLVYTGDLPVDAWSQAKEMTEIDELAPSISTDPNMLVSEDEQMTVTEKYQIWKADFTADEMAGYDRVCFMMTGNDGKLRCYASRNDADDIFIYASAKDDNGLYAVSSFLSFDKFKEIDAAGRRKLYVVGSTEGAIDGLGWNMMNPKAFDAEQGCFYIPVTLQGDKDALFKMSWISPAEVAAGLDDNARNDINRQWATFDLGIIGADDMYAYPDDYEAPEFKKPEGNDQFAAWCRPKESIRFLNYNQYDWYIEKKHLDFTGSCFVVVDPHSTCRTMTVIPYDPNPSVGITASDFGTMELTAEQAKLFNSTLKNKFHGSTDNGSIFIDRVNYCSGDVTVNKSDEHLAEWFKLTYNIYMNGDMVIEHENPDDILHLDYMPMASSGNIGVRCTHQSAATGLKFHSKLGTGTFNIGNVSFPAPEALTDINAVRVIDPGSKDGKFTRDQIGVLVRGIPLTVNAADDYAYFADFSFEEGETAEILHENHRLITDFDDFKNDYLEGWTPFATEENYDFTNHTNDWSTMFAKPDQRISIYLSNTGEKIQSVKGKLCAVYPFFYQNNPTVKQGESAPRKAVAALPSDFDLGKYSMTNVVMETPVSIEVSGDIVSGIENVTIDAVDVADAEYFTLSGVRVSGNPAPGLYLRRSGDTVSKVVVR